MTRRSDASAGTPATVALARAGVPYTARAYEHDPRAAAYGLEAAEKLGVEPERVFKTLLADVDGALAVAIVPVALQLDLKALAQALGAKRAEMADPRVAERKTGYVVGGISPIGQKSALPTVLDESAILCETVLVSGGRRGLDLELAPDDLIARHRGHVRPDRPRALTPHTRIQEDTPARHPKPVRVTACLANVPAFGTGGPASARGRDQPQLGSREQQRMPRHDAHRVAERARAIEHHGARVQASARGRRVIRRRRREWRPAHRVDRVVGPAATVDDLDRHVVGREPVELDEGAQVQLVADLRRVDSARLDVRDVHARATRRAPVPSTRRARERRAPRRRPGAPRVGGGQVEPLDVLAHHAVGAELGAERREGVPHAAHPLDRHAVARRARRSAARLWCSIRS